MGDFLMRKQDSFSSFRYIQFKKLSSLFYFALPENLCFLSTRRTSHDLTLIAHPVAGVAFFSAFIFQTKGDAAFAQVSTKLAPN